MRQLVVVLVAFLAFSTVLLASQPGQPLDCSDWVPVDPRVRCQEMVPPPCESPLCKGLVVNEGEKYVDRPGVPRVIDNDGRVLRVERRGNYGACQGGWVRRVELIASAGGSETVLGYFPERCYPGPTGNVGDMIRPAYLPRQLDYLPGGLCGYAVDEVGVLIFDPVRGRALIPLLSQKTWSCEQPPSYGGGWWLASIEGLTPLFDILDSFRPGSGEVGFTTPVHPEGFRVGGQFDTYWGQVTRPLDLSQAHPLQCAYPDHQPQVGEHLTFPDAAPTPSPGQAVYYLTSVIYQGWSAPRFSGHLKPVFPVRATLAERGS